MNEQIKRLSYEMRLYGINTNFESRSISAINNGQSHLEFLHLLLEDEKNNRKDKYGNKNNHDRLNL